MDDYQFELLRIKAAVCPSKDGWPSPDVQVSIMGDKPTISGGMLHWSALHTAVDDARDRVTKAFAKMAAIDGDRNLSPTAALLKSGKSPTRPSQVSKKRRRSRVLGTRSNANFQSGTNSWV